MQLNQRFKISKNKLSNFISSPVIENITKNNVLFAIIIRSDYKADGINFFTPNHFPQQLGYMNREKGYVIDSHKHPAVELKVTKSFETLIVKSGKVRVSLFDENDVLFNEVIICKNDVILFTGYGHGFEMLEDTELIEIKQGPYADDKNKLPVSTFSNIVADTE